jgi:hypothetical protein
MTKQKPKRDSQDALEELLSVRSPARVQPAQGGGISPLDLLELPPDLREVMNVLMRSGASTAQQVADPMHIEVDKAIGLLDTLVARGHVRQLGKDEQSVYEPILGRSRRPRLSSRLWQALEDES